MSSCRKFFVAFLITMLVAALGNFTQPAGAQQTPSDPVPTLLASFNLPDRPAFAELLDQAAARLAAANQGGDGPTTGKAVLDAAVADRKVYLELTPHLLAVSMEAISTRNPTPAQQEFYAHFQLYYGDLQQFAAIRTLGAWNEYRGTNVFPATIVMGGQSFAGQIFAPPELLRPPVAGTPIGPITMLIDTGKPVSGFQPPHDVLPMGEAGAAAITEVFGPMALTESPATATSPLAVGGDKTTAALAGLGLGAGVGVVSVGVAFTTVIASTTAINATIAAIVADQATKGVIMSAGVPVALFGAAGAVSVVSSVLIVIPLFIAAGMKISSVIETNSYEAALVNGAAKPNHNVNVRAIVDPVYVQDAGLWYKDCDAGHRGVATRCYKDCDAGYVDDGLLCRRPPDSFGKDSYQRGVGILECRPGLVNDAGLCYPPCPPGTRGVATRCYANCPTGGQPGTRLITFLFRDDGLFCAKLTLDFGRGAGYVIWEQGTCERNHGVGNCELLGLLWYPKCPAGFHMTTVNFCSQNCPAGWDDIGVSCPKPWSDRGVGVPIDSCPAGSERFGALCYPLCQQGFSSPPGLPNTCMSTTPCPPGYSDTGFTCLRNLHVYGKGFYDRGVGTVNRPADQDRELARKAVFTYLVRMLVADPADRGSRLAPVQQRSATVCPAGFVAQGALCGQPIDGRDGLAPTIRLERSTVTVDGVSRTRWDAGASLSLTGTPPAIAWDFGDGTKATGPTAEHTFARPGNYLVTVTAADDTGRTSQVKVDVAVLAPAPSALTAVASPAVEGAPTTVDGRFVPGDASLAHTVDVTWGDDTSESVELAAGTAAFALAHRYADDGAVEVKITVRDPAGLTTSATLALAVGNAPPAITITGTPTGTVDAAITLEGAVTDPGSADTVELSVSWGDGVTDTPLPPAANGSFQLSHQYGSPGTYNAVVTATDDNGGTASTTTQIVIAQLRPVDRVQRAIDALASSTDPALVTARRDLDGSNRGLARDGAIDQLRQNNLSSALGHLRDAVGALSGGPPSAQPLVVELTTVAREIALAATVASKDEQRVVRAQRFIAAGDQHAIAHRYRDAVRSYQRAVSALGNSYRA